MILREIKDFFGKAKRATVTTKKIAGKAAEKSRKEERPEWRAVIQTPAT